MRKLLYVFLLISGMGAFAQGMPSIYVTPSAGDKIEITASNSSSVAVLTDRIRFSLQKEERDRFIKFLDLHLGLMTEAGKLGLPNESTFITSYDATANIAIRSYLVVKDSVVYVSMHIVRLS